MNYENGGLSASDVALIQGRNNNGYGGFGGDGAWWIVLFLIFALGGWNNNGGFGGGFGGGGVGNEYAWLSNGQKEIMQNTNDGFNTLQLANQLTSINSGVQGLSTQLCSCCGDISQQLCSGFAGVNQTVNSNFANAETAANARQMANMQQNFDLSRQFADCCCENRLGIANLNSTILSENCADRAALQEGVRDIIQSQTLGVQRILDQLCSDKIDAKNEKIADLERQLSMADLKASQVAQNAFISQGFANEVDQLYNRLNNCPVPTTPVYRKNSNIHM